MFTLYYYGKDNDELTLELPCTQEEYTEVLRHAKSREPFMMDQEDGFKGVSVLDDISSLNVLAYLAEEAKSDDEEKYYDWLEFGNDCNCIDSWITLLSQYDDVEYTTGEPDYDQIGYDFMNNECSNDFIEKFDEAGFDVSEIGELIFEGWEAYAGDNGWFDISDYTVFYNYDYPDEYKLDEPPMYEPLDLRDREVLKDLFARTVYKDSDPKIVGFIVGCYINEDPTKCTVRIMGVDYTAEELMEFKDFYSEKPMAKEITE